jgi:hypothetical protein
MSKRLSSLFFGLFATYALASSAFAGPIQFPEGNAAWVVEIAAAKAGAPGGSTRPHPLKIEVTQSGDYRRSICRWSNGTTTECWGAKGANIVAVEWVGNKEIYVLQSNDKDSGMLVNYDESSFRWIRKDYLKGITGYRGKKCMLYEGMVSSGTEEIVEDNHPVSRPQPPTRHQAWIDEETSLPVALDDATGVAIFTFLASPAGPLTPPKRFLEKLQYYQRAMAGPKPAFPAAH